MPRSRSRSRSYSPRRRREPDRGDRGSYERRDERERDRKRREGERYDEDRRNRHSDRRPYSRERYKRPRRDEHEHEERFRNRQQNSHPPRHSRSPSRSHSPPTAAADKGKPNFKPSGLLAAETNTVKKTDGTSVVLKYNEPPEARRPTQSWRLYVFKGKEQLEILHIYRQSAYLVGRDQIVCDIPVDHPSCSKQHAVIQYRHIPEKDEFGNVKAAVKPFIIDLESTNSTFVNDEEIPAARYYELRTGDVIKFGLSTKEYVLLHEDL